MTNKQRVWKAIDGEACENPASQIDYTPLTEIKICKAYSLDEDKLFSFSNNCIRYVYTLGNVEEYFNKDIPWDERHKLAIEKKCAIFDGERRFVFDAFGVGWNYDSEGVNTEVHPLADMGNYSGYHWPVPDSDIMPFAKSTVEMYGASDFMLGFQHIGLFERSWAIRGYNNFMCDLLLEPDFVNEMLDNVLEYKLAEAAQYVAAGVDAVRIGDDWGLQNNLQISPELWRKFLKPRYSKLYSFYKSHNLPIIQHSCGAIIDIVPDLIEIGVDVLHPIQPLGMDLNKLMDISRGRLTLWGGIDTQHLLPFETPEKIREEVKRTKNLLGCGNRYIAAPSQEIMSNVPPENIYELIKIWSPCRD